MSIQRLWLAAMVCLWCLGDPSAAQAQSKTHLGSLLLQDAPDEPLEIGIGVKVHQITFIDQKAENFGVVGTLRLEWHDPKLAFDKKKIGAEYKIFDDKAFREFAHKNSVIYPAFFIQNQQGRRFNDLQAVIIFPDGSASYIGRFTTTLQAPDFNFLAYPFDTQKFFVHVVSIYPDTYVRYVPLQNFSELSRRLGEEEWKFTKGSVQVSLRKGYTSLPSTRFSFGFTGRRHLDYYSLRIFIPLAIFLLVSWATFLLEDFLLRIEIGISNLLIYVAFNFAISDSLPRLGYITFLDVLLSSMFVITGLLIVFNIGLRRLQTKERLDLARKIDTYALKLGYPIAYGSILSAAVYIFIYNPSLLASFD